MEIVDSQIHGPHSPKAWPFGDESELLLNVELAREAMDSVGVDAAVVNWSVEFGEAAVQRYPDRFANCVFAGRGGSAGQPSPVIEVDDPDIDGAMSAVRDRPGIVALRVVISRGPGQVTVDFTQGRNEPIFAAAEQHGLPIFITAWGYMSSVAEVAAAHPELTLIVDHLGVTQPPSEIGDQPWGALDEVLALGRFPNVALKICGAETLSSSPYPYSDVWPYLSRMLEAFTPDRMMWASDYTRLRVLNVNYGDDLHFIRETNELSVADKEKILGQTARRLLRWPAKPHGNA